MQDQDNGKGVSWLTVATKSLIYSCRVCRRISKINLFGAAATVRSICVSSWAAQSEYRRYRWRILNGIMNYEIYTEISGQCLISICDDIFQWKYIIWWYLSMARLCLIWHGQTVMVRHDKLSTYMNNLVIRTNDNEQVFSTWCLRMAILIHVSDLMITCRSQDV